MLDERDDITTPLTAAAIPNLLAGVNRESIGAAALRARPAALGAAAVQFETAPRNFILNADSPGSRDPVATQQIVVSFYQIHARTLEWLGSWRVREAANTAWRRRCSLSASVSAADWWLLL
jgi:hypothetical protein